jgi:hypothetical protein
VISVRSDASGYRGPKREVRGLIGKGFCRLQRLVRGWERKVLTWVVGRSFF